MSSSQTGQPSVLGTAQRLGSVSGTLLEGPVFDPRTNQLLFVDIDGRKLFVVDPATGQPGKAYDFDRPVTSVSLTTNSDWVVLTLGASVYYFNLKTEERRVIAEGVNGAIERLNDCRVVDGALFCGGLDRTGSNAKFTRVTVDGRTDVLFTGVGISNGFFRAGDSLFHIDSKLGGRIWLFDVLTNGMLSHVKFLTTELPQVDGFNPTLDGMCIDAQGYAWAAVWEGRCVLKLVLDQEAVDTGVAKVVGKIEVPTEQVTSCCIDNNGRMYITSANVPDGDAKLSEGAGALYCFDVGTPGVETEYFPGIADE